jgi:hypothetical protein
MMALKQVEVRLRQFVKNIENKAERGDWFSVIIDFHKVSFVIMIFSFLYARWLLFIDPKPIVRDNNIPFFIGGYFTLIATFTTMLFFHLKLKQRLHPKTYEKIALILPFILIILIFSIVFYLDL